MEISYRIKNQINKKQKLFCTLKTISCDCTHFTILPFKIQKKRPLSIPQSLLLFYHVQIFEITGNVFTCKCMLIYSIVICLPVNNVLYIVYWQNHFDGTGTFLIKIECLGVSRKVWNSLVIVVHDVKDNSRKSF